MATRKPLKGGLADVRRALESARVVFWDFDGVVKDSVEVKTEAFGRLFADYGADIAARVRVHHEANGGMSRYDKMPTYLRWANEPADEMKVQEFCRRFSELVLQAVIDSPWVPGVREYLMARFRTQKFILVTATPQQEIETVLDTLGLRACFEEVHGAPVAKSVAIREALRRTQCTPGECLMVGDADADLAAAHENEVPFLLRRTALNGAMQARFNGPMFDDLNHE